MKQFLSILISLSKELMENSPDPNNTNSEKQVEENKQTAIPSGKQEDSHLFQYGLVITQPSPKETQLLIQQQQYQPFEEANQAQESNTNGSTTGEFSYLSSSPTFDENLLNTFGEYCHWANIPNQHGEEQLQVISANIHFQSGETNNKIKQFQETHLSIQYYQETNEEELPQKQEQSV